MKNRAIKYLTKNPLLHMGMLETIRRGTANILYAADDGVLLKEEKSNAYMINHMLRKDLIPFAQIEVDNNISLALHNKLGFSVSRDSLFWIF